MYIFDSWNDLLKKFACLFFWNARFFYNIIKQFSTTCELHDQVKLTWRLYDLIELDNVRVSDQFKNVNFTSDSLNIRHVAYAALFKYFDCHTFLSELMCAFSHFTKSALSNLFLNIVLAHYSPSLRRLLFWLNFNVERRLDQLCHMVSFDSSIR